jgi:hypothetical protein
MLNQKFTVCYKKRHFRGPTPLEAVFECVLANPMVKFSNGLFVWHSCLRYREGEIGWSYLIYTVWGKPAKFFTKRNIHEIRCRNKLK